MSLKPTLKAYVMPSVIQFLSLKLEWNSILILWLAPVISSETHRAHGPLLSMT